MKITNKKYKNLNLANEEERSENLIIDFIISSIFGIIIAFLTFKSFTIAFLIYILVRFIYYFTFEYIFDRTPGKYQTQTKVVNRTGQKPTLIQLITRNLSRFISVFSGISDNERAIHDSLSNTFVIKNKELKKIEIKKPLIFTFYLIGLSCYVYYYAFGIILRLITDKEIDTVDIILLILTTFVTLYVLLNGIKQIKNYRRI